ncbi:MAG: efflux RND transporter periplasmic adaptor subunit, partial [Desulfitobacterium hafniense]|nr:efflux RND transporter periplasmic adaptor subunit [Desulfitobacterium hafniense]
ANAEGLAKNLEHEEKVLADYNQLYSGGAISKKEVETEQNKLDTIKAQYDGAKAQMDAAQASLSQALAGYTQPTIQAQKAAVDMASQSIKSAELALDKLVIKSPINGRVLYKHVELGQVVNNGSRMFTLVNPEDLWVKVYVPENRLDQVKLGGQARVTVDAYSDKSFKGEIRYISEKAEFTPKNVQTKEERTTMVFAVRVKITEGKDLLKAGMPSDVTFREVEL